MNFLNRAMDLIDEGVIIVNKEGTIKVYNHVAQDIFGLSLHSGRTHKGGQIKDGDIVILVDNLLGGDDGGLQPDDLNLIGIHSSGIKTGDAIVAIGAKGETLGSGKAKWIDMNGPVQSNLILKKKIKGVELEGRIDFVKRCLTIKVGDDRFDYDYLWCAGHMVILDKDSLEIKFYQSKGYTARGEELKNILYGFSYAGKGKDLKPIKIINRHISNLHTSSFIINELLEVAKGKQTQVNSMESSLNGIPVRCSIYPIEENKEIQGAMLKILDITELSELRSIGIEGGSEYSERDYRELKQIQDKAFQNIICESSVMHETIRMAKLTSETNSTILLQGESGTGKGLFAEAIHQASSRRKNSFVYVNCASIPENLLESELFGHEKGSFTGAFYQKIGKFEIADKGTIFLDEIGDVPFSLQAKLLHILQSKCFSRVGGISDIKIDVRVIAASNKNLRKLMEAGNFREDLFYRLNVFPISIPPLRERKQDIYYLVKGMLPELCDKCHKSIEHISEEFTEAMYYYDWPGNVRELENILERAITLSQGRTLFKTSLPDYIFCTDKVNPTQGDKENLVEILHLSTMKEILSEAEKNAILKALEVCGGKKKEAYQLLGIGKTNFFNKYKEIAKVRDNEP